MSTFDDQFVENLNDIIENGTDYESRAVWKDDGTPARCRKVFGIVNRYNFDYSNTPPVGTLRKFQIKNCVDELLWIWQKKSNKVSDLRSNIWDAWADANGTIGAAYGFQVATKIRVAEHDIYDPEDGMTEHVRVTLDQTDYVLHELKHHPFSRRIITDLYSIDQTGLMTLDPCCYSCTWNVTEHDGEKYLNLLLNQRSQDMIVANNWNVFQYWILQNLFAKEVGMKVGELVHVIADAHIYDRHIDIAKQLIQLHYEGKAKPDCAVRINDTVVGNTGNRHYEVITNKKSFYDYTCDDFELINYEYCENITKIPVAV
jgi:thymidylate synthase